MGSVGRRMSGFCEPVQPASLPPGKLGEEQNRAGLMQVSETLPPFTLRLSRAFVNGKQRISTGFLRVLAVFLENRPKMSSFWLFL